MKWRILEKLMAEADNIHQELKARKGEERAKPARFQAARRSWLLGRFGRLR